MNIAMLSVRNLQKIFATIALLAMVFSPFANVQLAQAAPGASADLSQGANGGIGDPVASPVLWVNGNVNQNQGHYVEGQSIPYRMVMSGLNAGVANTLVIGFDVKQGSKFAIDYITSDSRISETVSPCNGTGICTDGDLTPDSTFNIPAPAYTGVAGAITPTTVANSFNAVDTAINQVMKMWNGTISSISYTKQANISLASDDARVTIVFTPTTDKAVISWGGHISSGADYPNMSAVTLNGSPYHTRLESINGGGGNQDRSLAAGAVPPSGFVTVIKHVINDNGKTDVASDFTINATSNTSAVPATFAGSETGTVVAIPAVSANTAATYSFAEVLDPDYNVTYSTDCSGTIASGASKTCTITNDDKAAPAATLTLVKAVNNQAGGSAVATNWTLTADSATTDLSGAGGASGTVDPGTYTLSESAGPARYTASDWVCTGVTNTGNQLTLTDGNSATCTITNTYVPPAKASITVVKEVINDNGGQATAATFKYWVNGVTEVFHNVAAMFDAVQPTLFTLTETNTAGYTASDWGGDCATDGTVTLGEGESATCTITNNDIAPKLTVTKVVTNNSGTGDMVVADFPLFVGATSVVSGTQNTFNAGAYVVSETGDAGYTATFSGDCDANGNVTLAVGDVKSCTITNDDNDPTEATITINKSVVKDFGGNAVAQDFSFLINGTSSTQFESDGSNQIVVTQAGAYTITEPNRVDYTEDYSQCSFNVVLGQSYSCTVVNTQLPACSDGLNNDGREDQLIDYPADPGCDDKDDNDETDPATAITIDKVVIGEDANPDQTFNFNFSWTDPVLDIALSANDDPIKTVITPGQNLVITESLDGLSQWDVNNISCTSPDSPDGDPDLDDVANSVTLNFSVGEHITCVFTNNYTPRDSGGNDENIIIKKEVTEGSDTETFFGFSTSWIESDGDADFLLSDGGLFDSGDLQAGEVYSISEIDQDFWSLDNVSCTSSLDAEREISPSEFVLNDGETITCVFTNDQELFKLEGYVWEDSDEDGIYDEDESPLAGWDVQTTNGSKEYATTSAPDGYYYFFVPAGTWTISETLQSNWDQTFPVEADDFVHVVTVPQYYVEEVTFLENVFNFFVPTVYAQAPYPTVYGDYNFGNKPEPRRSGGGGGGGRRVTNDDPETPVPQVLGEATSIMPVGAPNTGKGGSAPLRATIPTIVGIATVGAALRRTK